jgi:hypothetical protein
VRPEAETIGGERQPVHRPDPGEAILAHVVLSRKWSAFLIAVGVWTWFIWPRFALAIWNDDRSFSGGSPTSFLVVHALLIVASLAIGTAAGVLGVRGWRASRR